MYDGSLDSILPKHALQTLIKIPFSHFFKNHKMALKQKDNVYCFTHFAIHNKNL